MRTPLLVMIATLTAACTLLVPVDDLTGGRAPDSSSGDASASSGDASGSSGSSGASASSSSASSSGASSSGASSSGASSSGGSSSGGSSCPAPEADLVAYYPFEETTGKVAHDCSGKGHDGTIMSAPASGAWTTGRFGGGFATDATSGCIDLGTPADLLLEGASFTVAAWAKATAFGTSTLSHYIFGKAKLPQSVGWRLGTDPAAWSVRMTDTSLGPLWLQSAGTLGTWTHVAATFAPNGAVTLYVDGASTATNGLVGVTSDPSVTVRIGCRGDNVGYFDGVLDEVRVYRRAFTATEVASLAARTP